jgi:hypothetical protein
LCTAGISFTGNAMYPIRHDANPYAFDSENSEIVCSADAPGIEPGEK